MLSRSLLLVASALALTSFPVEVESFASPGPLSKNTSLNGPTATTLQTSSQKSIQLSSSAKDSSDNDRKTLHISKSKYSTSKKRRKFIQSALVTPFAIGTSLTASQTASANSEKPPPIIPLITTARRLHAVPTFTIVDGNGIPFHTYEKESAGAFGYFFTTYRSAEYVLDDAKKAFGKAKEDSASKKEDGIADGADEGAGEVPDAWGKAQIVALPLDVVMQLSVKKTKSTAQNSKDRTFSTFYQVIPATEDLNAALNIENGPRYGERGRVPLFYVDGLTLPATAEGDAPLNPVYFSIKDLKAEWEKQHPGDSDIPTIKVRELNETFRAMIRPGGKPDESVRNLVFVPIPGSVEKAKASGRSYKLGEMILTK